MGRAAQRGFTLVELMVVVAIVAILAAIAIPALGTNYEDEFEKSARILVQDLMRAKSLTLARKEFHSLIVLDDSRYRINAVNASTGVFINPGIRDVTLPSSTKIVLVKQCADFGGTTACGSAPFGFPAEVRFLSTGEIASCTSDPATCTRTLRPMTIYLRGFKPGGQVDPRLSKKIVVFQSTGYIKVF